MGKRETKTIRAAQARAASRIHSRLRALGLEAKDALLVDTDAGRALGEAAAKWLELMAELEAEALPPAPAERKPCDFTLGEVGVGVFVCCVAPAGHLGPHVRP